jgi:hypothetical protein
MVVRQHIRSASHPNIFFDLGDEGTHLLLDVVERIGGVHGETNQNHM